ncbi:MAG: hypothetical protein Q9224_002767, partial [Gallowayella concinna]
GNKIQGKGGEKAGNKGAKGKENVGNELKRKAGEIFDAEAAVGKDNGQPPSKREMKRRAARARMAKAQEERAAPGNPVDDSNETRKNGDPIADDVASALLAERRPLEEDTTTLLARSAEAMVWNVDIWLVDVATTWVVLATIWYATIGNAAMGQRHEQSQGPDGVSEGARTAVDADESGGLAVLLLGLGIVGEIAGVATIGSKAPAVTTS